MLWKKRTGCIIRERRKKKTCSKDRDSTVSLGQWPEGQSNFSYEQEGRRPDGKGAACTQPEAGTPGKLIIQTEADRKAGPY